jgi:hypothetical protein
MVPAWSRPEPARRRVTHRASRRPRRTASAHRRQPRTRSSRGLRVVLDAALDLAGGIRSCWPAGGLVWPDAGSYPPSTRPSARSRFARPPGRTSSASRWSSPASHSTRFRVHRDARSCRQGRRRRDGEPTVCLLANRWLRHQHFLLALQSSRMRSGQGSRRRPDLARLPGRPPRPPSPHPRATRLDRGAAETPPARREPARGHDVDTWYLDI